MSGCVCLCLRASLFCFFALLRVRLWLFVGASICFCLVASVCASVSVCLYLVLFVSVWVSVWLCLFVSVCVWLFMFVSVRASFVSDSRNLIVSVCVCECLVVSVCVRLCRAGSGCAF